MATLIDAVINLEITGNCQLDLNKALNLFDRHCVIIKSYSYDKNDAKQVKYRLHRIPDKPKSGNFKGLSISISEEDAMFLLEHLELIKYNHPTFKNSTGFYHKEHLFLQQ